MAEEVNGELEVFSPLLLQEYIRLMTIATYINNENKVNCVKFSVKQDVYDKIMEEELKAPLIGLKLNFGNDILEVSADNDLLSLYENKIMRDVSLNYFDRYAKRYDKYITYKGV